MKLAGKWAQEGHRVAIATLSSSEAIKYDVPAGVRIIPLGIAGSSKGMISAVWNNFARLRRLRRLLRDERPDVVIGMMTTAAVMLAITRTRESFAIGAERNYPPRQPIGRFWSILRRLTYGRLDVITVQAEKGRDWLLRHTRVRRVVIIPNSIRLPLPVHDPVLPPSALGAGERKILLGVGRLVPQKAFDRLIHAFSQICDDHPQWDLVILGEGELRPTLEAQVGRAGLESRIKLPGWAGNSADWYRAADLCALVSEFEGFPNVLLEAMAHGCPVVSVDCDTGPRDIIRDGENGILVPQDDIPALTAALDRLLGEEELRSRLAEGASMVLETFSESRIDKRWEKLFDDRLHRERRAVER